MNDAQELDGILAAHHGREGALLPILHDVQASHGYISEDAVRMIAHALNLTRAEVHGVVSFYHDFREAPEPRPVVKLCRAESCQARGVEAMVAALPDHSHVAVETVYCLGLCSVGPAAMIGDAVHGRLNAQRLGALVEALA